MFFVRMLFFYFITNFRRGGFDRSRIRQGHRRQRLARVSFCAFVIRVIGLIVRLLGVCMVVIVVVVMLGMPGVAIVMCGVVHVAVFALQIVGMALPRVKVSAGLALALMGLADLGRFAARVLDDVTLNPFAIAAPA